MTNREWLNNLSDEKLAQELLPPHCECEYCITNAECNHICGNCYDKIAEWLKQKRTEPMPEIKAGDILLSTTPSEYYIAVASDKLLTARGLVLLDLEKVLRHDQIAYIKRWNGTDVETIWRYDNDR